MCVQQLYTSCPSQTAYYLESGGEAAIIDPLRDIDQYLQIQKERNEKLKTALEKNSGEIIDVRDVSEYRDAHIKKSHNLPLNTMMDQYATLDKNKNYYIVCGGGYRSMIACSILASKGFANLINVNGGMNKVKEVTKDLLSYVEYIF